jgi:hypothetical protein
MEFQYCIEAALEMFASGAVDGSASVSWDGAIAGGTRPSRGWDLLLVRWPLLVILFFIPQACGSRLKPKRMSHAGLIDNSSKLSATTSAQLALWKE